MAGLASCSSTPEAAKAKVVFQPANTSKPQEMSVTTRRGQDEFVQCQAEINTNPSVAFGFDIGTRLDVVPVLVTVGLQSLQNKVILEAGIMNPILFTEGGSTLQHVPYDQLREQVPQEHLDRFRQARFKFETLDQMKNSNTKVSGHIFFRLPSYSGKMDEMVVAKTSESSSHSSRLSRSMLQFTYGWRRGEDGDSGKRSINVSTE